MALTQSKKRAEEITKWNEENSHLTSLASTVPGLILELLSLLNPFDLNSLLSTAKGLSSLARESLGKRKKLVLVGGYGVGSNWLRTVTLALPSLELTDTPTNE